ncbi:DUF938 domain-containing protein [Aliiglaciecola litoralis]|uniref:Class I SAM-dependent methyltransferase n=1 Tax=Aliiglaciecola litoralis TaxID=582857 RepID=A0ABP3WWG8_9ALTE
MHSQKSFSQACENNKAPILAHLKKHLVGKCKVLEIGSGTGQHVSFFAQHFVDIVWQPTDVIENHPSIKAWVADANCHNVLPPACFFIGQDEWHFNNVDAVYSANTAHIMQPEEAQLLMQTVAKNLPQGGVFCQYGPFKINGEFTSDSNYEFDLSLRQRGYGGIRSLEELTTWAQGLTLSHNYFMPANNQLLIWHKGE